MARVRQPRKPHVDVDMGRQVDKRRAHAAAHLEVVTLPSKELGHLFHVGHLVDLRI